MPLGITIHQKVNKISQQVQQGVNPADLLGLFD